MRESTHQIAVIRSQILAAVLVLGCIFLGLCVLALIGMLPSPPSYESHFNDVIMINFPPQHPIDEIDLIRSKLNDDLRGRKIGYFDGVMSDGKEIQFMELCIDFQLVDEAALIKDYIRKGILPRDVSIEYHSGEYGSSAP